MSAWDDYKREERKPENKVSGKLRCVIVDVEGEAKQKLTVEDLLKLFAQASGQEFANDRAILS